MDNVGFAADFIDRFGKDTYHTLVENAGHLAFDTADITDADLPDDPNTYLLYTLLELFEHKCAHPTTDHDPPITEDELTEFLIRHYAYAATHVPDLPPRGAPSRRDDLALIYPVIEPDIRVEIHSNLVDHPRSEIIPQTTLGYDTRTVERESVVVCLIPCQSEDTALQSADAIPDEYPVEKGIPSFTDEITEQVDILLPVPIDVWLITNETAPGLMTLDGWDLQNDTVIHAQIGVLDTNAPQQSREALDQMVDEDVWTRW